MLSRLQFFAGWAFGLCCCIMWGGTAFGQDAAERGLLWNAYHESSTDTGKLRVLADLAYAYRRNDADSALILSKQVMEQSTRIGFSYGRAKAFMAEGAALLHKAEYEDAIDRLEHAITIFASLNENLGQAQSMNELGMVYYRRGDLLEATRQFETAIDLAELESDFAQVAKCWNNLGIVQSRLGNYKQALQYYQRSMSIREENGLPTEGATFISIGNLYNNLGEYTVSLDYYQRALPDLEADGNRVAYTIALYNIGTIHEAQEKNDSAMIFYQRALDIGHQLGTRQINAAIMVAMGNVQKIEQSYEKAEFYFTEVLRVLDSIGGDQSRQTVALLSLANLRLLQNRWTDAEKIAKNALAIAEKNEFLQDQGDAYEILVDLKQKQGQYQEAYQYLRLQKQVQDSLLRADVTEQLTQQRARYEFELEEKNYQLEIMDTQVKLDEAIQRSQRYRLWGLGLGLLLVSLLMVSLFVHNIQRKKTNVSLAAKNEELNEKNHQLYLSNQQWITTNNKLQQFIFAASHDLRESLRSITSFSQLLKRKIPAVDEEMQHYLRYITDGGQRMKKILDDLLSYSRLSLEDDKQEVVCTKKVIDSVLSLLDQEVKVAEATITIDEDLPTVKGHRAMFEQLFFNLLENCLKYRREDIPLAIHISSYSKEDHLCFKVQDNGMGIEEAYLGHIFDPFYRIHDRLLSGSGLGLAICRRIVELYNGEIRAESQLKVGTTIHFCMPETEVVALEENVI